MKEDHRKLERSVREHSRKRAIKLIESGKPKGEVATLIGVKAGTISEWWKLYQAEGVKGLKEKKRGVKSEDVRRLSKEQERSIQKMIIDKHPEQLKLNFALWTRKAVMELIEQQFGISLYVTTVGRYLKEWGYTPQKPIKRAYEQNSKDVEKWLEEEYPAINERAKKEDGEIHWGDETGVKNSCNHGRGYAPKGKTPVKCSMSKRFSINMISTITNQGKVQFLIYSENMNADKFIEFMQLLIKGSTKKIFLIVDNLKVHHCELVKKWLADEEIKEKIEVFYLPSYSPERNPDEYLNCDLKQGLSSKPAPKNQKKLSENVDAHMTMLQQTPNRVKKYFKHKSIEYAAAV